MSRIALSRGAIDDLDSLIASHSLPHDTPARVARSLRGVSRFPLAGAPLTGRWRGFRFVLGPWRWMVIVYRYDEAPDTVVVVAVEDGRSSAALTASR